MCCDDGHLRFQCECDDGLAGFGMILIGLWFMYCARCTVSSRSGVPGKEGGSKRKLVVGCCLDGSWVGMAPNLHSTSTYFLSLPASLTCLMLVGGQESEGRTVRNDHDKMTRLNSTSFDLQLNLLVDFESKENKDLGGTCLRLIVCLKLLPQALRLFHL